MKNIVYQFIFLFSIFTICNAQVSVGKPAVNGNSTLLDFYDNSDNTQGVIISAVTSVSEVEAQGTPAQGTFILDSNDRKVKVYENNTWVDLTDEGITTSLVTNSSTEEGKGIIIGSLTSTVSGVLVLEEPSKAMILPKIENPHINVPNPYPGMICYDTVSKSLAVYNGENWSYWK